MPSVQRKQVRRAQGLRGLVAVYRRSGLAGVEQRCRSRAHARLASLERQHSLTCEAVLAPSPFGGGLCDLRELVREAVTCHEVWVALATLQGAKPDDAIERRAAALSARIARILTMLQDREALSAAGRRMLNPLVPLHRETTVEIVAPSSHEKRDLPDPWRVESRVAWYSRLTSASRSWSDVHDLGVDANQIRSAIGRAAEEQSDWLYHPSLTAVLASAAERSLQGDVQLVAWLAGRCRLVGTLHIPKPIWIWTSDGGTRVEAGATALSSFRSLAFATSLGVDVWEESVGPWTNNGWRSRQPLGAQQQCEIEAQVIELLQVAKLLEHRLPRCYRWIESATRIVQPLPGDGRRSLRSGSSAVRPAFVYMDTHAGTLNTMELLVHESAHQCFFLREAAGELVERGHDARYWSPLRRDSRPLRSVFLAYHALAHICAFYRDAVNAGIFTEQETLGEREQLHSQLHASGEVLELERMHLTKLGNALLDDTQKVASYA